MVQSTEYNYTGCGQKHAMTKQQFLGNDKLMFLYKNFHIHSQCLAALNDNLPTQKYKNSNTTYNFHKSAASKAGHVINIPDECHNFSEMTRNFCIKFSAII